MREASPRTVDDPAACDFYHSIELPSFGLQEGPWDLRGRFDEYTGRVPLDGRTLLDVGTATGYLSFEAERRGATVTSFDVDDGRNCPQLPHGRTDPEHAASLNLERMRNGYWLAHQELGSKARCVYGNVYDLNPDGGVYDVVLVGQLLIHLADGLSALAAAASVCSDTIVVTEGSPPYDAPVALLAGRADRPEVAYAWYQYSHGWYREVLAMLGFRDVRITTAAYPCRHADHADWIELATIVGHR